MKTSNLVIAFGVLFAFVVNSYSQTAKSKEPVNSLKGGKWAFSFQIGSQVSQDNFGTLNLSVKSQITKIFAIRLGASSSLSLDQGYRTDMGSVSPQNEKNIGSDISLNFLFYTNPSRPFSFFLGVGSLYQYTEQKLEQYENDEFFSSSLHYNIKGWSVCGAGIIGAEWFPYSRFSIIAEYNLVFSYGKKHSTSTFRYTSNFGQPSIDVYEADLDNKTLNFNIVKLGVSAYF